MNRENKTYTLSLFNDGKYRIYKIYSKIILIISIMLFGIMTLSAEEIKLNQTIDKNAKSSTGIIEKWNNFSDTDIKKPHRGLSSVVVFRPLNSVEGPAVNIYIDGEYQASLLAGAYTQTSFCPGTHRFSIAYTNVLTKYKAKVKTGQKSTFRANEITYYQVDQDSKQKLRIKALSEENALALIRKLPPRQRHTISRLNKRECSQKK